MMKHDGLVRRFRPDGPKELMQFADAAGFGHMLWEPPCECQIYRINSAGGGWLLVKMLGTGKWTMVPLTGKHLEAAFRGGIPLADARGVRVWKRGRPDSGEWRGFIDCLLRFGAIRGALEMPAC